MLIIILEHCPQSPGQKIWQKKWSPTEIGYTSNILNLEHAAALNPSASHWRHPIQGTRVAQWPKPLEKQYGADWQAKLKGNPLTYAQQLAFIQKVLDSEDEIMSMFSTKDQALIPKQNVAQPARLRTAVCRNGTR